MTELKIGILLFHMFFVACGHWCHTILYLMGQSDRSVLLCSRKFTYKYNSTLKQLGVRSIGSFQTSFRGLIMEKVCMCITAYVGY